MHDWTLISVTLDWKTGSATLQFCNQQSKPLALIIDEAVDIHIPKLNSWGPSVSVNEVIGPVACENGNQKIQFELQSGDVITVIAKAIHLPSWQA